MLRHVLRVSNSIGSSGEMYHLGSYLFELTSYFHRRSMFLEKMAISFVLLPSTHAHTLVSTFLHVHLSFCLWLSVLGCWCQIVTLLVVDQWNLTFPSPKPVNAQPPAPSGQEITVLHLSDWHVDPFYEVSMEESSSFNAYIRMGWSTFLYPCLPLFKDWCGSCLR